MVFMTIDGRGKKLPSESLDAVTCVKCFFHVSSRRRSSIVHAASAGALVTNISYDQEKRREMKCAAWLN